MAEIETESAAMKPKKRQYNRKPLPPAPPAPPAPPSPAVIALENEIVELVRARLGANSEIALAMAAANEANSRLQVAQTKLQQIEREVQYRIALTQQMKGMQPSVTITNGGSENVYVATSYENGYGVSIPPGVGSIPSVSGPQRIVHTGPRVRSESAEGFRAEAI